MCGGREEGGVLLIDSSTCSQLFWEIKTVLVWSQRSFYLTLRLPLLEYSLYAPSVPCSWLRGGFRPLGVRTAGHQTSATGETCWKG